MSALCGWGGERCSRRLRTRGLCEEHRSAIRAAWANANPPKPARPARPAGRPPPPAPQAINPSDIFEAGAHAKTLDRARHMARWVAKIGEPVTAADAVRVAGLTMGGSTGRMLKIASDRGWITRDERGSVLPGSERP